MVTVTEGMHSHAGAWERGKSDLPEKKTDFVKGKYELALPSAVAKVAVKIVDMLGEETLVVK